MDKFDERKDTTDFKDKHGMIKPYDAQIDGQGSMYNVTKAMAEYGEEILKQNEYIVEHAIQGPQGIQGETGPQGPAGSMEEYSTVKQLTATEQIILQSNNTDRLNIFYQNNNLYIVASPNNSIIIENSKPIYMHDLKNQLKSLFDIMYPINSLYLSIENKNPFDLFGIGSWTQIGSGYALWTTTGNDAGSTIPAGVPNISGSFLIRYGTNNIGTVSLSGTPGPFTYLEHYPNTTWGNTLQRSTDDGSPSEIGFNAAAGEIHGSSWRNDVYGKSDTVQPPAYKIYAWRRTA